MFRVIVGVRVADDRPHHFVPDVQGQHLPEVPEPAAGHAAAVNPTHQPPEDEQRQQHRQHLQHHELGDGEAGDELRNLPLADKRQLERIEVVDVVKRPVFGEQ